MLTIGDVIRHYRIVAVLGRGGTGVVYKAEDQQLRVMVAMKVLDWRPADDAIEIGRMRKDAAAVQALGHPAICRVQSLFVDGEMLCIVSELVEGESLDVLMAGQPLTLERTVAYARQIASAFEAAHERAILHQDFKPSKVLVTPTGIKIVDFGVGWLLKKARSEPTTALRGLEASISYASPEELRSEPEDARSDLFSFGAVLYEMATGVAPFRAPGLDEAMKQILTAPLKPPRDLNDAIPRALEELILKALERDRSFRYHHASEMRIALDEVIIVAPDSPGAAVSERSTTVAAGQASRGLREPSRRVGRYEVVRPIARGAAGAVYEGRDPATDRQVVIKRTRRPSTEAARAVRMARVHQLLGLRHRNVSSILDVVEDSDDLYLIVEYIKGSTLAAVLSKQSPLPFEQRLDIMEGICAGLDYIHAAGVIHGDIKPGNLMIAEDGLLKIIDFELWLDVSPAETTHGGSVIGTPAYMAPERMQGRPISAKADIFSAGAVFYELLAERRLFDGTLPEVMNAVLHGRVEPLESRAPSVPPELARLVHLCLARDAESRDPDLSAVRAELERILQRDRVERLLLAALAPRNAGPEAHRVVVGTATPQAAQGEGDPETQSLVAVTDGSAAPPVITQDGAEDAAMVATRVEDLLKGVTSVARPMATSLPDMAVAAATPDRVPVEREQAPEKQAQSVRRALDLAVPRSALVHRSFELVALMRQTGSPSLRRLLLEEGYADLSAATQSRSFGMELFRDRSGRLKSTDVVMRVVAPDFDPPQIEKIVRVRPDEDCERQVFLLTPTKTGALKIQFDVLRRRLTLASRSLDVISEADSTAPASPLSFVSVPLQVAVRRDRRGMIVVGAVGAAVLTGGAIYVLHDPVVPSDARSLRVSEAGVRVETVPGKSYALVFGTNEYASLPALRTAVPDARALGDVLRNRYGFSVEVIENATRFETVSALNRYRTAVTASDSLLVYYAGHGYYDADADKAYWLPADAHRDNSANWIIADEVTSSIRAVPARHVLVIADSCYSGGLSRDAAPSLTRQERDRYLSKMLGMRSRTLMASGGNEPVADGAPGARHSVFAGALLDGLNSMVPSRFTGQELFQEFVQTVVGRSQQVPQYHLIRNSGHDGGDFVFTRHR